MPAIAATGTVGNALARYMASVAPSMAGNFAGGFTQLIAGAARDYHSIPSQFGGLAFGTAISLVTTPASGWLVPASKLPAGAFGNALWRWRNPFKAVSNTNGRFGKEVVNNILKEGAGGSLNGSAGVAYGKMTQTQKGKMTWEDYNDMMAGWTKGRCCN
jgi:hypothetical protein